MIKYFLRAGKNSLPIDTYFWEIDLKLVLEVKKKKHQSKPWTKKEIELKVEYTKNFQLKNILKQMYPTYDPQAACVPG